MTAPRTIPAALGLLALLAARPAVAEGLAEFEAAARSTGCRIIPYTSLRARCEQAQQQVTDWCKNASRPISCKTLTKAQAAEVATRIANGERCVASRKDVAATFTDARRRLVAEAAKDIKAIAARLVALIDAGEPGHRQSIQEFERAVANCRALR